MSKNLKKLLDGLMTKSVSSNNKRQQRKNEAARAKYLTNPTRTLNPKKNKYF